MLLAEGDIDEEAPYNFDVNLKDYNKAIVGFRSCFCDYLEGISVYTARRLDIQERLFEQSRLQI